MSSAEIAAAQIVGFTETEFTRGRHRGGNPPSECPRHRQEVKVIFIITVIIITQCGDV